ncbi:MAG: endonuclease [Ruminococcaceae bacterium]|nr:endonuclease [Oscillospiraceae bacterium]
MAVTKTHPIKSTLKAAIDYICDPAKTDGKLLVSSFGCTAETADIEFAWTRRNAIDKGTNLGRHLIQAFEPGEVLPEEAHEIGMQLAKEVLGCKYEFVLTTHIDKNHVHNHLIFNAVSFEDYKHYRSNRQSYHEIRRVSDRLCKEHGLSVVIPGQDKGKSYVGHQTAKSGTSYKSKLKAAIDRLIPASADFEDLLRHLQSEGYEIKRGKCISFRATEQERFTRLKTLGEDYTEEAIAARIAGKARPSKQPKQRDERISLLIDIQNSIKAQESAGFAHWAKVNNLKQAAKTINFLTEHGIDSYEELEERLSTLTKQKDAALASIKEIETKAAELSLVMKYAETYRKLKPVYNSYRQSRDKEKFLRGHESDIILFEAAARELKKMNAIPIPTTENIKVEMVTLVAKKKALFTEYKQFKNEAKEHEVIKTNVDAILDEPTQQAYKREIEVVS